MNFGVVSNSKKDPDHLFADIVINSLNACDQNVLFDIDINSIRLLDDNILSTCDFVYVLGGDGTILASARFFAKYKIGIIGVNIGRLGYLTELDLDEIDSSVHKIINKEYFTDNRFLLECSINGRDNAIYALNEILMSHAAVSRLVDIEISINGHLVDHYLCDGIMVSTPTGSTAYSLSAGGPVISPDADCMLITPVCPHTLHSKNIILKGTDVVNIKLISDDERLAVVAGDGQDILNISSGEICEIKKSDYNACFLRFKQRNFFELLQKKLSGKTEKSGKNEK